MPYQRQILLSSNPVPSRPVILLSGCAHLAVLVLIFALRHATGPHIVAEKPQTVQRLAGPAHVTFNPAEAQAGRPSPLHLPRSTPRKRVAPTRAGEGGTALQVLREHAKAATAGMVASIRQRQFYGFSTEHFDLAAQTAGMLPVISAAELPPRFEQYVTVEVTIDVDGRVADARIVGGEAPLFVQKRLLSAVREFRYTPARRDGTPIPSQLDLVVHIPS